MRTNHVIKPERIHVLAYRFADQVNVYLKNEGIEKVKLQYGMELLFRNLSKLIVILSISALLGIFFETFITLMSFNILRAQAFGLHGKSSKGCLISSFIVFVLGVYSIRNVHISNVIVIGCFAIFTILLAIYAPADTEKRPLVGKRTRKELKRKSIVAALFLMCVALLIPSESIKTLIVIGAMIEVITILPVTYYLLKMRRKNYENYEREY